MNKRLKELIQKYDDLELEDSWDRACYDLQIEQDERFLRNSTRDRLIAGAAIAAFCAVSCLPEIAKAYQNCAEAVMGYFGK